MSILVGAPDPALRERFASTLRQHGHQVLEAANAQDMRARLAEHAQQRVWRSGRGNSITMSSNPEHPRCIRPKWSSSTSAAET
jgi:hypothetical protein